MAGAGVLVQLADHLLYLGAVRFHGRVGEEVGSCCLYLGNEGFDLGGGRDPAVTCVAGCLDRHRLLVGHLGLQLLNVPANYTGHLISAFGAQAIVTAVYKDVLGRLQVLLRGAVVGMVGADAEPSAASLVVLLEGVVQFLHHCMVVLGLGRGSLRLDLASGASRIGTGVRCVMRVRSRGCRGCEVKAHLRLSEEVRSRLCRVLDGLQEFFYLVHGDVLLSTIRRRRRMIDRFFKLAGSIAWVLPSLFVSVISF